jgi:hypothetical protein
MDTKQISRIEVKDADKGEVTAVIATFDVVDSDGDVTLPDAFAGNGEFAISAYGHTSWGGALPVGKARLRTTRTEAILEGQFFMDTAHGRDTFATVKHLGPLGQWSYGYDVLKHSFGEHSGRRVRFLEKLLVHEGSPTLVGAGVNTRTLSTKSRSSGRQPTVSEYSAAIRPHETDVEVKAWNPAAVEPGESVSDLRAVHAWVDPAGDPETKSSYRFPHHSGPGGPANVRACVTAIAALNSGRAGIPDADVKGVYEHLAAHLRDADREPPALKSAGGSHLLIHQIDEAMAVVSETLISTARVGALRAAKGKGLSRAITERLEWLTDDVRTLQSLLTTTDDEAAREYMRFVAMQHKGEMP